MDKDLSASRSILAGLGRIWLAAATCLLALQLSDICSINAALASTTSADVQLGTWVVYDLNATQCNHCGDLKKNYLCGTDFGIVPDHLKDRFVNKCIRYEPQDATATEFVTRDKVFTVLGDSAVIAFVGDSNARYTFEEALVYLGIDDWWKSLSHLVANVWKNKNIKATLNHTWLCTGPRGPANITLTFIWNKFHTLAQHYIRRPWSRCGGNIHLHCNSSFGIPNCDGSDAEGKDSRWPCGDLLDQVQLPGSKRKFNVITHGGIWDVMHIFKGQDLDVDDHGDFGWINSAAPKLYSMLLKDYNETITAATTSGKSSKCWTTNGLGGKEILMAPFMVQGPPCPTCGKDITKVGGINCKKNNSGFNRVLRTLREHQLKSGVVGTIFDDYIDAFDLTNAEYGAPFPISDGIHFPNVLYRAVVHIIMHKLIVLHSTDSTA